MKLINILKEADSLKKMAAEVVSILKKNGNSNRSEK